MADLTLQDQDDDTENLFASPSSGTTTPKEAPRSQPTLAANARSKQSASQDPSPRETALKAELAQIRHINSTLTDLNASLTTAKENLSTVQTNMTSAKMLLATWSRVLSQTEHNQRLILDPNWTGATRDMADLENEETRRREEVERRVQEVETRREEAQRKREDESTRREDEERRRHRGLGRSRSTRGTGTGMSGTGRGYGSVGSQAGRGRGTTGNRAGGSGIGRGITTGRGRGRG